MYKCVAEVEVFIVTRFHLCRCEEGILPKTLFLRKRAKVYLQPLDLKYWISN